MTDDRTQSDKFKDAARELQCDEDEGRWEQRLRIVVTRNGPADDLKPEDGPATTG
jgi:hypothetical protein